MTTTNIADLKNNLSEILRRVEQGEEIAIARRNAPFATIKPLARRQRNRTQLGCLAGSVVVCGDLTEPAVANSDWDMHQG
jgi:prevent-host-death family protein